MSRAAKRKARNIRLLALDVDGVLSDGGLRYTDGGEDGKVFCVTDGLGIKMLQAAGVQVAIITGRRSRAVEHRAAELGIGHLVQGRDDKLVALRELTTQLGIDLEQVAYMGDDLPDLAAIRACALGMVPADGDRFVASHADWRSRKPGGRGAVREACEFILDARGALDSARAPFLLALLLALLLAPCVHVPGARALDSDAKQPIHIVADEAVSDERAGLTLYRGNVTMSQGSIHIEADQVAIHHADAETDKIVATGSPAHMRQRPEPDSPVMNAWGDTIEYYHKEDRMLLLDNAQLEQDGSILKGDRIDYFINDRLVKAASEQDAGQRVRVVIPPHKLEE